MGKRWNYLHDVGISEALTRDGKLDLEATAAGIGMVSATVRTHVARIARKLDLPIKVVDGVATVVKPEVELKESEAREKVVFRDKKTQVGSRFVCTCVVSDVEGTVPLTINATSREKAYREAMAYPGVERVIGVVSKEENDIRLHASGTVTGYLSKSAYRQNPIVSRRS